MKARLLQNNGTLQLLLCTGEIRIITFSDAKEFILSFDNLAHYDGPGSWDYEGISMETYGGDTIAFVDDAGILCVINGETFRNILSYEGPRYLTVPEYATLHGRKSAIVRRHCANGLIKGVIQKGTRWLIPEDAEYPFDD